MLEINEVYHADCLEKMKEIDDKSIDFICVDLPYQVTQHEEDIIIPFEPLWEQYKRIIKDRGGIVLFGQGLFYVDLVNSNREMFKYDLVWDKVLATGFLNANRMPMRVHEQIAVFYNEMPKYNPQKWTGQPQHARGNYQRKPKNNNNYGDFEYNTDNKGNTEKNPISIVQFQKPHPSVAVHRTQKPVELVEYLIKTYTDEGDLVLDSCAGSGTTGIACINTKRNYILIEKNEEYFHLCQDRLRVRKQRRSLV